MKRTLTAAAMLLACFALFSSRASSEEPLAEGSIENLAIKFDAQGDPARVFRWTKTFSKPTSNFLRLHIQGFKFDASEDFKISIANKNGIEIRSFGNRDRILSEFWSPIVRGDSVTITLTSPKPTSALSFGLDKLAYQEKHAAKFSLVHSPPELEEIITYKDEPNIFVPSRAVAKLVFSSEGKTYTCTGFLISLDRFLTNQHCIDRPETCVGNAVAVFGYEITASGLAEGEQFDCAELITVDATLDFALVRLANNPGSRYGWLDLTKRKVEAGEQAYLIQHPNGEPKQIARKQCNVSTLDAEGTLPSTDIGHRCDTVGGASGSPLLGTDFKVIGVHHLGFSSLGRWKNENRAIQITKVIEKLAVQ